MDFYGKVISYINSIDSFRNRDICRLFTVEEQCIYKSAIRALIKRLSRGGYIKYNPLTRLNIRYYIIPSDLKDYCISARIISVTYKDKKGYVCYDKNKYTIHFKENPDCKKVFQSNLIAKDFIQRVKQKELYAFEIIRP